MAIVDGRIAVERCHGAGGAHESQPAPRSVDAELHTEPRRRFDRRVGTINIRQSVPGRDDAFAQLCRFLLPCLAKCLGSALEVVSPAHHTHPRREIVWRLDLDRKPKTIEKLGAKLALFWISRPDEH